MNNNMSDAEAKLKEMGEKIKSEVEAEKGNEAQMAKVANSQLEAIRANPDLAKMYAENATLGADNLAGELPLLKVHQVGKSTKNELSSGVEPDDGYFFYKPTGEQFNIVKCHILTISKGFRAQGIDDKEIFNQIVGGVIVGEGEDKPFIMYMTGLKLQPLWTFGKEMAKYTRSKPMGIPMFALTVKMSTERVSNNYGKSWIINFEVDKNEDGTPVLVTDPAEFQFLKEHVATVQDTIASIIEAKSVKSGVASQLGAVETLDEDGIPF